MSSQTPAAPDGAATPPPSSVIFMPGYYPRPRYVWGMAYTQGKKTFPSVPGAEEPLEHIVTGLEKNTEGDWVVYEFGEHSTYDRMEYNINLPLPQPETPQAAGEWVVYTLPPDWPEPRYNYFDKEYTIPREGKAEERVRVVGLEYHHEVEWPGEPIKRYWNVSVHIEGSHYCFKEEELAIYLTGQYIQSEEDEEE